ncbi:hypothetical protein ACFL6C_13235 [Myxococcota bacterium]
MRILWTDMENNTLRRRECAEHALERELARLAKASGKEIDGIAHCWGRGTAGQLGNGSFSTLVEPGAVVVSDL